MAQQVGHMHPAACLAPVCLDDACAQQDGQQRTGAEGADRTHPKGGSKAHVVDQEAGEQGPGHARKREAQGQRGEGARQRLRPGGLSDGVVDRDMREHVTRTDQHAGRVQRRHQGGERSHDTAQRQQRQPDTRRLHETALIRPAPGVDGQQRRQHHHQAEHQADLQRAGLERHGLQRERETPAGEGHVRSDQQADQADGDAAGFFMI